MKDSIFMEIVFVRSANVKICTLMLLPKYSKNYLFKTVMFFNIRIKNKLNNYFTLGGQNQGKATFPNLFHFLWAPSILKLVAQPGLHLHQWPLLIYHRVSSQILPMTSLILGSPLKLRLLLQWPLMASHCATSADFHDHFITSKPL